MVLVTFVGDCGNHKQFNLEIKVGAGRLRDVHYIYIIHLVSNVFYCSLYIRTPVLILIDPGF